MNPLPAELICHFDIWKMVIDENNMIRMSKFKSVGGRFEYRHLRLYKANIARKDAIIKMPE